MMIHTSSGVSIGKQSDIKAEEEFYNPWLSNLFHEIYKDFLTKKEIDSVLDGKDMWLNADQVVERFKKKVDIINRANAKAKREHMRSLQSFMSNLQNKEGLPGDGTTVESEAGEKKEEPAKSGQKQKPSRKRKSTTTTPKKRKEDKNK
jgi:hypothetical protein